MKGLLSYRSLSFQLFILALLFQFQDNGAQILYVGPNETYTNIKWALGQAKDGDTILVRDGVYVEDIKVRVSVVLMAENLHGAVIGDGSAEVASISISQAPTDGVVVDGFKFAQGDLAGIVVGDNNPDNVVRNCVIRNNYVENRARGIRVTSNSTNLEISGNTFKGIAGNGIDHMGIGDNIISGNVLENCGESGIWLPEQFEGSFTISDNKIRQNGGVGIGIERSDIVIEGNIIEGNQIGISTNCGRNNIVVRDSNQIINNISVGINIECGTIASIENNIISGNGEHGIVARGHSTIKGNSITRNTVSGIIVKEETAEIENNSINSNGFHGIEVGREADDVQIIQNSISENGRNGIMQLATATIDGNTINDNKEWGIFLQLGSATITNNVINSNGIHGIEIGPEAGSVVVRDNHIASNIQVGIMTFIGAVLTANIIDGNGAEGILIAPDTKGVEIKDGNIISNNGGHEILVDAAASALIRQNTIENDSANLEVGDVFSGIYIAGSAMVDNNLIRKISGHGIYVHETALDVVITGQNQVTGNTKGISVFGPALINNNLINDNLEHGVWIRSPAENVNLTWNRVENNTTGISIQSGTSNVILRHNNISSNIRGVFSTGAPLLRHNTIQYNIEYGINIRSMGIDLGNPSMADSGFNAILDNVDWNLINEDSEEILAIGNYWGSNVADEIDSTILDNDEDSLAGPVIFEPYLTEYNVGLRKSPFPENGYQEEVLKLYPNPTSQSATIQFRLEAAELVNMQIIDLSGRVMQSLISDQYYQPGLHRIDWDGYTADRRKAPGGIYIVVLKASRERHSGILMLVE